MPKYNEKKDSNKVSVNYLDKDFNDLKKSLINYAKSYFPNTYNDFNETSPGMMLMEMSAYVGDSLNFYIDQQYKEMLLDTAEEKRNVINLAKILGYKNKAIVPAFTKLKFTQEVNAVGGECNRKPDFDEAMIFDKGVSVQSSTNSNVFFETLDILDFTISGSSDIEAVPFTVDDNGLTNTYQITREILAVSGRTKKSSFNISSPQEFLKLTLPDKKVNSILSVIDSSGNNWYEVDYLAQDKIFNEIRRSDPYGDSNVPAQYDLEQSSTTNKRFIVEVDEDNNTHLIFGNGLVKGTNGNYVENVFNDNQDVNSIIQGGLQSSLDPAGSVTLKSLGEAPTNTTLTITYRTGGGLDSNVPSNDLEQIITKKLLNSPTNESTALNSLLVTNVNPDRGGNDSESIEEIKEKAKANFTTQNRCVTKEDYEARVLAMPARFGNVTKVYVQRKDYEDAKVVELLSWTDMNADDTMGGTEDATLFNTLFTDIFSNTTTGDSDGNWSGDTSVTINENQFNKLKQIKSFIESSGAINSSNALGFGNINIYVLSSDNNSNLVKTPLFIKTNIQNYISQFRLLTDDIEIKDGRVVNFGVKFDIIARENVNKAELKLKCIDTIIDYFDHGSKSLFF